jgi:hypothetical protein
MLINDQEIKTSDIDRFWKKVNVLDSNSCWNWIGCIHRTKYGSFRVGKKSLLLIDSVRRFMTTLLVIKIIICIFAIIHLVVTPLI